jgi:hypothetical protein
VAGLGVRVLVGVLDGVKVGVATGVAVGGSPVDVGRGVRVRPLSVVASGVREETSVGAAGGVSAIVGSAAGSGVLVR